MAVCKWCNQETIGSGAADSCTNTDVQLPDGIHLEASGFHEPNGRCHDCGNKHFGW